MERVVPCAGLCTLIALVCPEPTNGGPPVGMEWMLCICWLQHCWGGRSGGIGCATIGS